MKRFFQTLLAVACAIALGQIPITNLPQATVPLAGTEPTIIVQGGVTKQTPVNTVGTPLTTFTQITSLWTPLCNNTTFLRGDGQCQPVSVNPAGNNTDVQFNNSGAFGGSDNLAWNNTNNTLTINQPSNNSNLILTNSSGNSSILQMTASGSAGSAFIQWSPVAAGSQGTVFIGGTNSGGSSAIQFQSSSGAPFKFHNNALASPATNLETMDGTYGTISDFYGMMSQVNSPLGAPQQVSNPIGLAITGNIDTHLGWSGSSGRQALTGVAIQNTSTTGTGTILFQNDSTLPAAHDLSAIPNYTNCCDYLQTIHQAIIGFQGTSAPIFALQTGAPTGEALVIGTTGLAPVSFGVQGISVGQIRSDGSWLINPFNSSPFTHPALLVNGQTDNVNVEPTVNIVGPNITDWNFGLNIQAGTSVNDYSLRVGGFGVIGGTTSMLIRGDASGNLGPPNHNMFWFNDGEFRLAGSSAGQTLEVQGNTATGQSALLVDNGGVTSTGANPIAQIVASNTANHAQGLQILAGSSAIDYSLLVQSRPSSTSYFEIFGDGSGFLGPNTTQNVSWNTQGGYTFNAPTAGTGVTFNGLANNFTTMVVASSTSGQSFGEQVKAGTTAADWNTQWTNQSGGTILGTIYGNGGMTIGNAPTGGDKGAGTINVSSGYYVNGVAAPAGPITCTTACSGASLVVGQSLYLNKGTSTSRNTTTTQTIDPDLNVTATPSGYFIVDISLYFGAGANAGGYRAVLNNGGACNTGLPVSGYWQYNNNTPAMKRGDAANAINFTSASTSEWVTFHGTLQGNAGISVCWAQDTSNATNTTLNSFGGIGTFIVLTRVN
jgi:hypothetical protein